MISFKTYKLSLQQKRECYGTRELNKKLQEELNPKDMSKLEKTRGKIIFRVGDRVMQIKNNYDK